MNKAAVGRVSLAILTILVFLFSAGTVFTFIPVFGSVANIVTIGFMHLWLPLSAVLVVLCLVLFLVRKKRMIGLWIVICFALSLAFTVVALCGNAACLRQYGVMIPLRRSSFRRTI